MPEKSYDKLSSFSRCTYDIRLTSFLTHQSMADTGTVVALWRYPVKSMMGEELNSSYITERGLVGDRTYAVVDKQTGKVASAEKKLKK
jgi:uncharacterized protein